MNEGRTSALQSRHPESERRCKSAAKIDQSQRDCIYQPKVASPATVTVSNLRCEYCENPLGLDTTQQRLGWQLNSDHRAEFQTAYQIVAGSSSEKLVHGKADVWDSGKVLLGESVRVVCAGQPLRSRERIWWKVCAWDAARRPSDFSEPAWFEMALLSPDGWKAKWNQFKSAGPMPEAKMFEDFPAPR